MCYSLRLMTLDFTIRIKIFKKTEHFPLLLLFQLSITIIPSVCGENETSSDSGNVGPAVMRKLYIYRNLM